MYFNVDENLNAASQSDESPTLTETTPHQLSDNESLKIDEEEILDPAIHQVNYEKWANSEVELFQVL